MLRQHELKAAMSEGHI